MLNNLRQNKGCWIILLAFIVVMCCLSFSADMIFKLFNGDQTATPDTNALSTEIANKIMTDIKLTQTALMPPTSTPEPTNVFTDKQAYELTIYALSNTCSTIFFDYSDFSSEGGKNPALFLDSTYINQGINLLDKLEENCTYFSTSSPPKEYEAANNYFKVSDENLLQFAIYARSGLRTLDATMLAKGNDYLDIALANFNLALAEVEKVVK